MHFSFKVTSNDQIKVFLRATRTSIDSSEPDHYIARTQLAAIDASLECHRAVCSSGMRTSLTHASQDVSILPEIRRCALNSVARKADVSSFSTLISLFKICEKADEEKLLSAGMGRVGDIRLINDAINFFMKQARPRDLLFAFASLVTYGGTQRALGCPLKDTEQPPFFLASSKHYREVSDFFLIILFFRNLSSTIKFVFTVHMNFEHEKPGSLLDFLRRLSLNRRSCLISHGELRGEGP